MLTFWHLLRNDITKPFNFWHYIANLNTTNTTAL